MITVIGIGPGKTSGRTLEADAALHGADVLVGYAAYLDLLKTDFPDKPCFATAMRGETERCREALRLSREGKHVALCCSGDAQVYGMAALVLEMAEEKDEVQVIPGVTAALSAAALLGAPLSGDFAVVSLSDLLTPWATIEKRLHGIGVGDFPTAIYNPGSHKRTTHLARACEILMQYRTGDTPCGLVQNIGRDGQKAEIMTLARLHDTPVDMLTTVIIGNSETVKKQNRLVTPRGYRR